MRLQIAWNKASDHHIYQMSDVDIEGEHEDVVEQAAPLLLPDSPGKTRRPSRDASPTGGSSASSQSALLAKLDRLEGYLEPLLAKIDVVTRMPTSDNNRKMKKSS